MSEKTNRDSDKFMLRLPDGLRDKVRSVADENGRSMNGEIVEAIKRHLQNEEFRLNPQPSQVDPEVIEIMRRSFSDPSDLPATKSDIDKLYDLIEGLKNDRT